MRFTLFIIMVSLLVNTVTAQSIWVSPTIPTINGNGYVFVTINTTASTTINMNITDPNGVVKRTCDVTTNVYGYATCKYNFSTLDSSGEWGYNITGANGNFNVSKINLNVTILNEITSVDYGDKVNLAINITFEGIIQKPIVARGISRDVGTHAGKNDMADLDGDGDLEIIITDYNGRIWVYENMDRLYNNGTMLITGTDWRSTDTGTKYLFTGCDYGDFDNDGKMTIICSDYAGAQLEAFVDKHPSATRDVAPTHIGPDEGDNIRTEPIICDVTGDGIPDQVAVNIYDGTMIVYDFNDTTGFSKNYESADLGNGHYGTRALCDDFDGDGLNEWMLCIYNSGCRLGQVIDVGVSNLVIEGDAQTDRGAYYSHGDSADMDGDGQIEYIVVNTNGRVEIYEFNTSGTELIEETISYLASSDVGSYSYGGSAVNIGDYNLNGKPDFVLTDTGTQTWFYELNEANDDWIQTEIGQGYENTYVENAFVDFDGDGIKEIMAFGRYSGNVYVYKYNGESWDLIYEGWDHDFGETSNQGDGVLFSSAINNWLYGLQCAQGDADADGKDEAVCMAYQGRGVIFEEADRVEENVSAEIEVDTETNGAFVIKTEWTTAEIRLHKGKTLALIENTALGITDSVDEDNQNQGSLNPYWTDGLTGNTVPTPYSSIDSSSVEEAVYSRIKLGNNYTVGAIRTWKYFGDGRSYKNMIIRSTTNSNGNLCDFSTNDVLFDNSADGINKRYGEDRLGKMIYFEPIQMSCLRESTAGSSYWTTAASTANHRSELQIFETKTYVPVSVFIDEEEYTYGDNVTIDVSIADFTGNLINAVATTIELPVTEEVQICPHKFSEIRISNSATDVLFIN